MCVLGGSAADMVFTDPPYTVDYQGAGKRRIANDVIGDGFGAFLQAACAAFVPVTKGAIYICMSSSEFDTLKVAFGAAGGYWTTFVIWAKSGFNLGLRLPAPVAHWGSSNRTRLGARPPTS